MTGFGTVRQALRLVPQFRLHFRQILPVLSRRSLRLDVAFQLVKRRRDDFLFTLRNLLLLFPATTAAASARLLALRIVEFKRHRLDEKHIGLSRILPVLSGRIDADNIARHQLEIFHAQRHGAVHLLRPAFLKHREGFLRRAIHRIVQFQGLQRELVFPGNLHRHFFNRAHLGITARLRDLHHRRRNLARLNEIIVRQPNHIAVVHHA